MEIREGIRYEYATGKYAIVKESIAEKGKFYANFDNGGTSSYFTKASWVKDFKSGSIKLIEYPYKVGDWVFDIENTYSKIRRQILSISKIDEYGIWCIDIIPDKMESYLSVSKFNQVYRPCFKDEIPKTTKPRVKKEKKEDYSYLVDLFRERGIT